MATRPPRPAAGGVDAPLTDGLGAGTYKWEGNAGWVRLDPAGLSAHGFSVTSQDASAP